ncbi:MAG: hypothetical protein JSR46_03665 [Verrucomicrobia bacterium]|nr:hypothetical protein [Verrucomicrobiota bacterium]
MIKKSPPVLADAVIVIGAHEQMYWEFLCNSYKIGIPATILEDEVFYFQRQDRKHGLTPSEWVKEGKVARLEAGLEDYEKLNHLLSKNFMDTLDPGEQEALALLGSSKHKGYLFCTADKAAIRALGVLGWRERGISVETLLKRAGRSEALLKRLPYHFSEKWFNNSLQEGFAERHLWLN